MTRKDQIHLTLSEAASRGIAGPGGRHSALIEDAFDVLIETPGSGARISGDTAAREAARATLEQLAARIDAGFTLDEADVRSSIASVKHGPRADQTHEVVTVGQKGPIAAKTPGQAAYVGLLQKHELVFGVGPAGTGKTFLAAAYGAALLKRGEVRRLVITRPAVEAGERLGFLPGDMTEKVDPYLAPIWSALDDILGAEVVRRRRDRGEIEVAPLAFMRGRTLSDAFVLVDEAQNATRSQMKMVLTRLGEGSRMVVTGDPTQIDLRDRYDSGLAHAVHLLDGVEGVGIARLAVVDVVRHRLVERILRAYEGESISL